MEEDFTFPAAAASSPPHFIESPPLWRRPSPSHKQSKKLKGKAAEDAGKFNMLHSFREFKGGGSSDRRHLEGSCQNEEGEEEKMDMLWEDLNDEFSGKRAVQNAGALSPGSNGEISCVQALKLSKANRRSILSGKKLSLLVLIKILKKAFLLHSSHPAI